MFLPSPDQSMPSKITKDPTHVNYSVILGGDFQQSLAGFQAATTYTVRSHLCGLVPRVPELGMRFNPMLLWDIPVAQLGIWKTVWSHEETKPLWMTTLVCQPPTTSLTLHIEFADTCIGEQYSRGETYKIEFKLENKHGVVMGDMLNTMYDVISWPIMNLQVDRGFCNSGFEVLLEASA
jgi:hypothetical protein